MACSQGEAGVCRPPSHRLDDQAGKRRFPPRTESARMALQVTKFLRPHMAQHSVIGKGQRSQHNNQAKQDADADHARHGQPCSHQSHTAKAPHPPKFLKIAQDPGGGDQDAAQGGTRKRIQQTRQKEHHAGHHRRGDYRGHLGPAASGFPLTILPLRSTTFSENHATAIYEYPHAPVERVRCRRQMLLRDGTPG